mmetsp:Transcript_5714/g.11841  ORF Transcript_5714/g.11841 Transcript_5714/m.11841 type:complete len:328 (+) Transcript_5714:1792-2775(+)
MVVLSIPFHSIQSLEHIHRQHNRLLQINTTARKDDLIQLICRRHPPLRNGPPRQTGIKRHSHHQKRQRERDARLQIPRRLLPGLSLEQPEEVRRLDLVHHPLDPLLLRRRSQGLLPHLLLVRRGDRPGSPRPVDRPVHSHGVHQLGRRRRSVRSRQEAGIFFHAQNLHVHVDLGVGGHKGGNPRFSVGEAGIRHAKGGALSLAHGAQGELPGGDHGAVAGQEALAVGAGEGAVGIVGIRIGMGGADVFDEDDVAGAKGAAGAFDSGGFGDSGGEGAGGRGGAAGGGGEEGGAGMEKGESGGRGGREGGYGLWGGAEGPDGANGQEAR